MFDVAPKPNPTHADAVEAARRFGAKEVKDLMNWTWAKEFPSEAAGREFVLWLERHNFEHRGYYPAAPDHPNPFVNKDGVRFREAPKARSK